MRGSPELASLQSASSQLIPPPNEKSRCNQQTTQFNNTNSSTFGGDWWLRVLGLGLVVLAASNALNHEDKKRSRRKY